MNSDTDANANANGNTYFGSGSGSGLDDPSHDLGTWSIERLRSFTERVQDGQLEAVRVVAQQHAYSAVGSPEACREWARLSLRANQRMSGDRSWDRARKAHQNFMLRMWVIERLGPDPGDRLWDPEALAADTVSALDLTPVAARALAEHWPDLAIERIGELRRHKNLTAHAGELVGRLRPGPVRDLLLTWSETRPHLP
ncbi:hypothetical protein QBB33_28465 [Streptomyces scabiei]|uniref:hypothetical protein n=1 Tax=Streptomyces scabiei TaxID=1930 RepID=UPI001FF68F42|nr:MULTISPECIES: hypothetical protein [Streptomyces]MDX3031366.1 hypothetical protein [Streptomyces scabiei]MDX3213069.1 hypothetical protein [Streptomyces scabiei]